MKPSVDELVARLEADEVVARIWRRDHTVWRQEPTEISNRLGWLEIVAPMEGRRDELQRLATVAADDGVRDVVLLGMGGSSLGAEALVRSLGQGPRGANLQVLDSTVPGTIEAVRAAIDPERTWFVVASKSGTTAEVDALLDYFWGEVADRSDPGQAFVAVTDPGTPLAELARRRGFRRLFLNPPDIGGRFSALSLFGLVPAALAGLDLAGLLESAAAAGSECGPDTPVGRNPAVRLGAFLGSQALSGRPVLTLLTSPRLAAVGQWVEQLVAESTGKDGTGILPVAGEPVLEAERYGSDRCFVVLRLDDDDNRELDARVDALRELSAPLLERRLGRPADLGGEMFVWELATAVAGHLLDVQPFDQPDVQTAKTRTVDALERFERTGALSSPEAPSDLIAALGEERPAYIAILGYLPADPELERAVLKLRRALAGPSGIPTTWGYGPRYLHSTGQLHKGGFPGGLFAQVVEAAPVDLPIPGRPYGFATLARAQADGDLLALRAAGRRVVRLALEGEAAAALLRLASTVRS